jgi:hypothetical protein
MMMQSFASKGKNFKLSRAHSIRMNVMFITILRCSFPDYPAHLLPVTIGKPREKRSFGKSLL